MKWKRDQDEYSSNHFFHTIIFYAFIYLVIFGTDAYVDYSTDKNSQMFSILVFLFSVGVAIAYIIHSGLQYNLWAELSRLLAISLRSIDMMNGGVKGLFSIVSNILWYETFVCNFQQAPVQPATTQQDYQTQESQSISKGMTKEIQGEKETKAIVFIETETILPR